MREALGLEEGAYDAYLPDVDIGVLASTNQTWHSELSPVASLDPWTFLVRRVPRAPAGLFTSQPQLCAIIAGAVFLLVVAKVEQSHLDMGSWMKGDPVWRHSTAGAP